MHLCLSRARTVFIKQYLHCSIKLNQYHIDFLMHLRNIIQ